MMSSQIRKSYSCYVLLVISLILGLVLVGCDQQSDIAMDAVGDDFTPVPFPDDLGIPGFTFPEEQATIDNWVSTNDLPSIYLHGWGIWAGLTADSGEQFEGEALRVFETWYTPEDILCITGLDPSKCPDAQRHPNPLGDLHQLTADGNALVAGESTVEGFVKYDPTAADHIITEQLFNKQHLQDLLAGGANKIPDFPNTAISLKPVFQPLACPSTGCVSGSQCTPNNSNCTEPLVMVTDDGRYAQLRVWPGSKLSCAAPGSCFPANPNPNGLQYNQWPDCVWIDTQNGSDSSSAAASDCSSTSPQTPFNMDEFISFQDKATNVYAVLVGMHVTSREITRWTWQSFWWTPSPEDPQHPSSQEIANARPSQLTTPANNYAMSIGYSMVTPAQPDTGGQPIGESIYAFNPYLEAGFGTQQVPLPITGDYTYDGLTVPNNVGVETNCMSCHIQATLSGNLQYSGDQYIDLEGAEFNNELRLDFLWSIQANAVDPPQQ